MSKYVIETKNLTKQYGTQKSVADLNIHVQARTHLRSAWQKRSRKDNDHENAAWADTAHFREVAIWGQPLRTNEKKAPAPDWQSD